MERVDHCRIGSLEMNPSKLKKLFCDHCRIGSLEKQELAEKSGVSDHCRIGSLEKYNRQAAGF